MKCDHVRKTRIGEICGRKQYWCRKCGALYEYEFQDDDSAEGIWRLPIVNADVCQTEIDVALSQNDASLNLAKLTRFELIGLINLLVKDRHDY